MKARPSRLGILAAGVLTVALGGEALALPVAGQGQSSSSYQTPTPNRTDTPHQITTSDGSVIEGTITKMDSGSLSMKTKFSQPVSISQGKIVAINTTDAIEVVTYDNRFLFGTVRTNADGTIVVTPTDGGAPVSVQWADIAEIYKGPPRWEGSFTFGFSENRGNSETLDGNIGIDADRYGEKNRFTTSASFSVVETFSSSDSRKASGSAEYDHYLRPRLYAHVVEEVTHDLNQDLTVRSAAHVGVGYDVLERPKSLLSVEIGAGMLINRYETDTANNDTDPSFRGAISVKLPFSHGITATDDLVFFIHSETHTTNTLQVSFRLSSAWSLKVTSTLQVSSEPSVLADEWDHQTVMGVTYNF